MLATRNSVRPCRAVSAARVTRPSMPVTFRASRFAVRAEPVSASQRLGRAQCTEQHTRAMLFSMPYPITHCSSDPDVVQRKRCPEPCKPDPAMALQEKAAVETAIKEAEEACKDGTAGECAAAWDNVRLKDDRRDSCTCASC